MKREELKQLLQGAIATVPTPFDDDFEVDYGRLAELTPWWIENGLVRGKAVLKVAAAMGEGYQLRDTEWPQVLQTVVQAASGRVPVVCGIHHKDTLRTIEDAKRAQDLGATGLQVSPPIYNSPTQDDTLRYYEAVSNAIDIGIMVYNTHWMHSGDISQESFRKMTDFEQVVVLKWNNPPDVDYEAVYDLAHTFNIIDNTNQAVRAHKLGARGFINVAIEVHPRYYIGIWDLMEAGRYEEAQAQWDSVIPALIDFFNKLTGRSGGQARVKKAMMAIMGHPVGVSRPPSLPLNDQEMDELREMMIGWGWPTQQ